MKKKPDYGITEAWRIVITIWGICLAAVIIALAIGSIVNGTSQFWE